MDFTDRVYTHPLLEELQGEMVKIGKWYPYGATPEPVVDDKVVKKARIHEENVNECKKLLYNRSGTSGDNKSSDLAAGNLVVSGIYVDGADFNITNATTATGKN